MLLTSENLTNFQNNKSILHKFIFYTYVIVCTLNWYLLYLLNEIICLHIIININKEKNKIETIVSEIGYSSRNNEKTTTIIARMR